MALIGNDWDALLESEWDKPYYKELCSFLRKEYEEGTVYPPADSVFNALRLTPYEDVKVVILGQDPYHEPGQAHGLAFSVLPPEQPPKSLVNIFRELEDDLGIRCGRPDPEGYLVPWARNGILLLNTVLTVRAHQADSHKGKGWETFTDRIIELLARRSTPMVFILWGANAGAKAALIREAETAGAAEAPAAERSYSGDAKAAAAFRHLIIRAPHPSPLSAYRGFFGGRYFSRANYFLEDNGIAPVSWEL